MKGNEQIIATLNTLLAEELTAISQYMVHSELASHWGFEALHKAIEKIAIDEMRHAEWLIGRILFLGGNPVVSKLNPINVGHTIPDVVANDLGGEYDAIKSYNAAIAQAGDLGDQGTADLLTKILGDEETHAKWGEVQQTQISLIGLQNYLAKQG